MTGPHPDPLALDQNLEPSAVATLGTATSTVIDASAAISLKRIADALEALTTAGATGPLQGDIWGFVSNLAWEAGRNFQAGTRTDR